MARALHTEVAMENENSVIEPAIPADCVTIAEASAARLAAGLHGAKRTVRHWCEIGRIRYFLDVSGLWHVSLAEVLALRPPRGGAVPGKTRKTRRRPYAIDAMV